MCYYGTLSNNASAACTDAGADFDSFVNEHTGYDIVQTAANAGQFEAVIKLVEAGASWRLAKGQPRVMGGSVFYVPEILRLKNANGSGLKVSMVGSYCSTCADDTGRVKISCAMTAGMKR
jgi:hypothetical protein